MYLGYFPLYVAVQMNDTKAVEYLLKYHANPDIQNALGKYSSMLIFTKENIDLPFGHT